MQLWPLLLMFPCPLNFALLQRLLRTVNVPLATVVPSVCLGSHSLLQHLHYYRRQERLLLYLKAAMVSSLDLGSNLYLTSFALLQRILGTVNVLQGSSGSLHHCTVPFFITPCALLETSKVFDYRYGPFY